MQGTKTHFLLRLFLLIAAAGTASHAFPPAPPHLIYGTVRDPIGYPLDDGAEVILEAASDARLRTFVLAQVDSSINYRLEVPMDAGLTSDLYSPTALLPAAPFRLQVRVGRTTFLPIEMTGDLAKLGEAGGCTRIDLTLGIDADGNGLPEEWEKAVAARLGHEWRSGQIDPDDPYPGAGLTYRDVYLAGTYTADPDEGFTLQILDTPAGPKLTFTAVKGRRYTVQAAGKLGEWAPTPFRILSADPAAIAVDAYHASETRRIEIEPALIDGQTARFFRLMVE